ncbi:uncharacterized protein [Montipora capricornis]|uniref:uncharacterized protein isoform X2 n=1 Tax=Montipora capricornis TaxID=246305 RepID=UPI0035F12D40
MEAYEQMIKDTRRWLREVEKRASGVTPQQLARLETAERVLRRIRPQKTGTHNETYQRVCIMFIDDIILITRTALISKATHNMSQGKSDLPEILPKFGEIKGYLEQFESKNKEIDRVMNQIEEMLEMRDYEPTEKEMAKVKRLLLDLEAISKQAEIYAEAADKTLVSLTSEVESYKREQGVSGWNVFLSVIAGAGVGALGVASFPVVVPAAAVYLGGGAIGGGAIGGGAIGGVGRFLYETDVTYALLFGASVGLAVSGLALCLQLKRWYATRNFCNRLCSIIQNYSDKVDEMNRLLHSRRM